MASIASSSFVRFASGAGTLQLSDLHRKYAEVHAVYVDTARKTLSPSTSPTSMLIAIPTYLYEAKMATSISVNDPPMLCRIQFPPRIDMTSNVSARKDELKVLLMTSGVNWRYCPFSSESSSV